MVNIYQLFPRLFGNTSEQQRFNGTIEENGCGKFRHVSYKALQSLSDLGITHIWLTGIMRHAKLTSYAQYGIPESHPSLLKGRAGSPYAIADYYDVDPDLADNVLQRMEEFEAVVRRVHSVGLKVLIDFVPNHVARQYHSIAKPANVANLGEHDRKDRAFHPQNNFYYLLGKSFIPPEREDPIYRSDQLYTEQPAKVSGNDCFSPSPGMNDWFETAKLNYGIDFFQLWEQHFNPIPDTWYKMLHILRYWANKGVDGFRCDMAEMVPLPFWHWAIAALKKEFPELLMIAEIYQLERYHDFVSAGFDYLYDKVGLYDKLMNILLHRHSAQGITECWRKTEGLNHAMLRFMENHDEIRIASWQTGLQPLAAIPAIAVAAFMHPCAFMIYNGQESGEKATGAVGFSGDDGRTSIFDYCAMPQHQKWFNNGLCDGALMSYDQIQLRNAYRQILRARLELPALQTGKFYDLMWANPWFTNFDPQFVYAFLRYQPTQKLVVLVNFNKMEARTMQLKIPFDAFERMGYDVAKHKVFELKTLLGKGEANNPTEGHAIATNGVTVTLPPSNFAIFELIAKN